LQIVNCRMRIDTVVLVLLSALSWAGVSVVLSAEIIDRVLAVVAGQLIMQSDVAAARGLGLVSSATAPDATRETLSRLIDRALILAEVDRYAPPEPEAAAVDREIQAVRARLPSAQAFEAVLKRVGIDEQHLRETLRQDLRIRAYLDQRFTVAAPGEEDLRRYYRDHAGMFTRNGTQVPFEEVRPDVARAVTAERQRALVDEWIAGLRRRAEIVDLYSPPQP
jgi:hypothetical protein